MPDVTVREADSSDHEALLAFSRGVRGEAWAARWEATFDWRWHHDPRPRPAGVADGYVGAVAEVAGRVVASVSCLPAGLYIRGEPVEAYWQFDSFVHPDFRRRGLAGRLMTLHAPRGALLAKGTSEAMLAARHKAGFADVPGSGWYSRTLRVGPRVARLVGWSLAGALAAGPDAVLRRRLPAASGRVRQVELSFDERFDDLWERVCRGYDCLAIRNAAALRWRFAHHPTDAYTLLTLEADSSGELRGYAVLEVVERRRRPLGRIVDLLTAADDEEGRRELIAGSLHMLHAMGADSAACYATGEHLRLSLLAMNWRTKPGRDPMTQRGLKGVPHVTTADGD